MEIQKKSNKICISIYIWTEWKWSRKSRNGLELFWKLNWIEMRWHRDSIYHHCSRCKSFIIPIHFRLLPAHTQSVIFDWNISQTDRFQWITFIHRMQGRQKNPNKIAEFTLILIYWLCYLCKPNCIFFILLLYFFFVLHLSFFMLCVLYFCSTKMIKLIKQFHENWKLITAFLLLFSSSLSLCFQFMNFI